MAESKKTGSGILDLIERIGNKLPEPAMLFLWGTLLVMALSHVAYLVDWTVQPKKLQAVYETTTDPATGQEVRHMVMDGERPVTELVDNGAPIKARSLLTMNGLYYAISSMVDNFIRFPPLGVVLVGMLGVGVAEKSGFIGAALKALVLAVPRKLVTPTIVFLGISSSVATDAGYIVLPPVAAALYKAMGRSPLAGIAAAFAGVAAGFNANLLITSLDPLLAGLTGPAAQTVDPAYAVNPACNWWFMIASTFLMTLVGWFVSDKLVEPRLTRRPLDEGGPAPVSTAELESQQLTPVERRGLKFAALAVVLGTLVFVGFKVFPGAPFDDAMRHANLNAVKRGELLVAAGDQVPVRDDGPSYEAPDASVLAGLTPEQMRAAVGQRPQPRRAKADETPEERDARLAADERDYEKWLAGAVKDPRKKLSDADRNGVPGVADHFDRWAESIVPMIFFLFILPGIVYGAVTGSIRKSADVVRLMVDSMAYMAPIIVLSFFAAQFISYFAYSRLDRMLAYTGGEFLAGAQLGPEMLIIAFVLVTMVFNMLIASMSAKYTLFAPIFVPMFMLVGISPELTQGAYRIGDSVTNILTPLNSYMVIILVVVQKHASKAGMGTLISMMIPYSICFVLAWLPMLLLWMQTGLPLGPNGPLWYVAR